QGVLKKHPFCGAFLVFWGFKFLSMNLFTITSVARTAETRSVRSRQQTGKNGNKPPEKLPRSHPVNFNHMHSYAAM
ncbi:hypothetical protein PO573_24560, partial [Escherichia coli]